MSARVICVVPLPILLLSRGLLLNVTASKCTTRPFSRVLDRWNEWMDIGKCVEVLPSRPQSGSQLRLGGEAACEGLSLAKFCIR